MSLGRKVSEKLIVLQPSAQQQVLTGQLAPALPNELPDILTQQDICELVRLDVAIEKASKARADHRAWVASALAHGVPVERGVFSARLIRSRSGRQTVKVR